jgi:hypothetical protein
MARVNDSWKVFKVRITDGNLKEVQSLKDARATGSLFGAWYGLSPDDSPLVLRNAAIQEIYALDVDPP